MPTPVIAPRDVLRVHDKDPLSWSSSTPRSSRAAGTAAPTVPRISPSSASFGHKTGAISSTRSAASPRWSSAHGSSDPQPSPRPGGRGSTNAHTLPSSRRALSPSPQSPSAGLLGSGSGSGKIVQQEYLRRSGDPQAVLGFSTHGMGETARGKRGALGSISWGDTGGGGDGTSDSGRIRVAVRVRPFSEKEKLSGKRCIISMTGNQTRILDPAYFDTNDDSENPDDRSMWERTFSFDHSFWSHSPSGPAGGVGCGDVYSTQADVHRALGEFLLENACRGFNCSLFAYGQTGSGKTYTMLGDSSDLTTAAGPGTAGLIPRICVELFQRLGLAGGGGSGEAGGTGGHNSSCRHGQASVNVSFCEIYNEQVRDLFCQGGDGHGLRVREHPTKGAFVEGLSARPVTCNRQVQHLLDVGMSGRVTAATAMNELSSRSHAIFTIAVSVTTTTKLSHAEVSAEAGGGNDGERDEDVSVRTSKICLVDLAGSERANVTSAKGDRLREASNINKSLSTLGDVIKALAKRSESGRGSAGGGGGGGESFIPYRNSILTWLLKDSIGGNSKTVMLAAISPVADAYQETMSTLRYVERAKDIVNSISINDADANPLVGKLRQEIRGLQKLLEQKDGRIAELEEKEAVLLAALERERTDDDDNAAQTAAAADSLQVALHKEKRKRTDAVAAAAAEAGDAADAAEQRHRQELDTVEKSHRVALETLRVAYEEDKRRLVEEEAVRHREEMFGAREQAAVEVERLSLECEKNREAEQATLLEDHRNEMRELIEEHKKQTMKASEEAAGAAAAASTAAAVLTATVTSDLDAATKKYAKELAERRAELEAQGLKALDELRQRLKDESLKALMKARRLADEDRKVAVDEAVAEAQAPREQELSDVRRSHAAELASLREELETEAATAVREEQTRLRREREVMVKEAVAARETVLQEEHRERIKKTEKDCATQVAAACTVVRAAHDEELKAVRKANARDLARTVEVAETRRVSDLSTASDVATTLMAKTKAEALRSQEALKAGHREDILRVKQEHLAELGRFSDAEKLKSKTALAAASDQAEAGLKDAEERAVTALAFAEEKHQAELREIRQTHDAETKRVAEAFEERERVRLADLEQALSASLCADAKAEKEKASATMEKQYEQNLVAIERKWQNELEQASKSGEERRLADLSTAEARHSEALATAEAEAQSTTDAILAAENEQHRQGTIALQKKHMSDIEGIRTAEEERRIEALAVADQSYTVVMVEARAEYEAKIATLEQNHREQLDQSAREHYAQIESISNNAAREKTERESEAIDSKNLLASTVEALKADTKEATALQGEKHLEELQRVEDCHREDVERIIVEGEKQRVAGLDALRKELESSLGDVKEEAVQAMVALRKEHAEQLTALEKEHQSDTARLMVNAEDKRVADIANVKASFAKTKEQVESDAVAAAIAVEKRHLKELREADDKREAALRAASERRDKAERELSVSSEEEFNALKEAYEEENSRLMEEHAAAMKLTTASLEEQRVAELARAEIHRASSIDNVKMTAALHLSALKTKHEDEIRDVIAKEREAADCRAAESAAQLSALQAEHTEARKNLEHERDDAVAAAAEAVKAEAQRSSDLTATRERSEASAAKAKADHSSALFNLEEAHRHALVKINEERKSEIKNLAATAEERRVVELSTASEYFATELLEAESRAAAAATTAAEKKHLDALEAQRVSHVSVVAEFEADRVAAEAAAAERLAAKDEELLFSQRAMAEERATFEDSTLASAIEATNRDKDAERQRALDALEETHREALWKAKESYAEKSDELLQRVEAAEAAVAEADASADELSTRAVALEEMLQASVGSREEELAGHRARVAQLQTFVARREAADVAAGRTDGVPSSSPSAAAAARIVRQRIVDFRVLSAGGNVGGAGDSGGESNMERFTRGISSSGLIGDVTIERHVGELEAAFTRSTVESAVARQDHLEADMQLKSVTRELVGLKLVHAQLRERLEDTQVQLEHKSQSAARRWLASAAKLAQEFARPDRHTIGLLSPKSRVKVPRAMGSRSPSRSKSPIRGRTSGGQEGGGRAKTCGISGRSRSPPTPSSLDRASSTGDIEFDSTV